MQRTSIRAGGLVVLAALVLVSAGCGGGGKKAAATATASSATTTAATTATATQTGGAAGATTATTKTSDLSGLASASSCKQLADLGAQYAQALGGAANANDLKKTGQLLEEFASKTPSDIRPDFKVVADAYSKLAGTIGKLKPGTTPDAATLAKLQKLVAGLDQAKLTKATQRIGVWLQKNCHG